MVRWGWLSVLFLNKQDAEHVMGRYVEVMGGDGTYADDALGADKLDELVRHASLSVALAVRLEVAQVTDVAGLVLGGAVVFAVGVDCADMVSLV